MDHWAYHTDDDEPTKKETTSGAFTFQQPDAKERRSADCSRTDTTVAAAVTNAPGDPSWWQMVPPPEKATPLPRTGAPDQPFTFTPESVTWTQEATDDEDTYQDPRLPPGVIDISEEPGGGIAKGNARANGHISY